MTTSASPLVDLLEQGFFIAAAAEDGDGFLANMPYGHGLTGPEGA